MSAPEEEPFVALRTGSDFGILYDGQETMGDGSEGFEARAIFFKMLLHVNPRDNNAFHGLLMLLRECTPSEKEKEPGDNVTPQEHLNATTAVRNMLAACRRAEADRLAKKQAAFDALCQSMADIRIGV